jgi:hypothetical protein
MDHCWFILRHLKFCEKGIALNLCFIEDRIAVFGAIKSWLYHAQMLHWGLAFHN